MIYDVAIITPFFNTEEYLHRCIQSVLIQENVKIQFFLIDDKSTDRSRSIVEYYSNLDSRIILIRNEENIGQGESRNKAIKLVNAKYIYFLDSDDYLETKDSIKILYDSAEKNGLDICSPDVPKHYFEHPLEAIPCLPCKSQFIKSSIVKDFDILQPNIRSGQDGVFSHLVLAHCSRIGMNQKAKLFYTHAREGSTFQKYLKQHDVVVDIIRKHYEAIITHYDKYNLWQKNALRLSFFLSNETIRNRVNPHFSYLTYSQKEEVFSLLKSIAERIIKYLGDDYKKIVHPIIMDLVNKPIDDVISTFEKYSNFEHKIKFKNNNFIKDNLLICKIGDSSLTPNKINSTVNNLDRETPHKREIKKETKIEFPNSSIPLDVQQSILNLKADVGILKGKLDLALNMINNSTIRTISAIRSNSTNLNISTKKDLIVSLTTLPHRLPMVHYAIESILSQTILPEKIILWISNKVNSNLITPELISLMDRGLEIKYIEDIGPHTKLIYSLMEYPDKTIVTIDDDVIYPMNTLQYLWEQHINFPKAIIANWARELAFDKDGNVRGVRAGKLLTPILLEKEIEQAEIFTSKPNILAFPYGTSGVLYPPKSLNSKVTDVSLLRKLCPKEDDIWFKAMSLLNRTPVVVTNLGINPIHHSLIGTQQEALRHHNHGLNQNEKQMRAVFEYFNLYSIVR